MCASAAPEVDFMQRSIGSLDGVDATRKQWNLEESMQKESNESLDVSFLKGNLVPRQAWSALIACKVGQLCKQVVCISFLAGNYNKYGVYIWNWPTLACFYSWPQHNRLRRMAQLSNPSYALLVLVLRQALGKPLLLRGPGSSCLHAQQGGSRKFAQGRPLSLRRPKLTVWALLCVLAQRGSSKRSTSGRPPMPPLSQQEDPMVLGRVQSSSCAGETPSKLILCRSDGFTDKLMASGFAQNCRCAGRVSSASGLTSSPT
eukprot:1024868-Pelagomonas_calceolata.AAC.1